MMSRLALLALVAGASAGACPASVGTGKDGFAVLSACGVNSCGASVRVSLGQPFALCDPCRGDVGMKATVHADAAGFILTPTGLGETVMKAGECVAGLKLELDTTKYQRGAVALQNENVTWTGDDTGAPTTGAPSTGAPTTGAPSTGAPTTGAPSTGAPTTGAPSTGVPSTGVPTTGTPNTAAPTTGAPTTGTPTTGAPTTGVPTTGEPTTGQPGTFAPLAPGRAAAALDARTVNPTTGKPTTGTPSTGTPSTGVPTTGTPSTGTPATAEPSTGVPTTGTPTTGTPTTGTPSTGTPTTGTPTTGTPSTGVPTTGTPSTGVPTTGAPRTTPAPRELKLAQDDDMSSGAIVALAVGCTVLFLLIVGGVAYVVMSKPAATEIPSNHPEAEDAAEEPQNEPAQV